MCRKLICTISFVAVLGMGLTSAAQAADPDLVAHWRFDETSGTTAVDSSGNGHDGTLMGDPTWVAGKIGSALDFDGSGDYVDCGASPDFESPVNITVACWIKVDVFDKTWQAIITTSDSAWRVHRSSSSNNIAWGTQGLNPVDLTGTTDVSTGDWFHVACVFDGLQKLLYINGELDASSDSPGNINTSTMPVFIGENSGATGRFWDGLIDDVRIYKRALTETELLGVMTGGGAEYPLASGPDPANGALHEDTWVTLSWRAGDYAVSHDVYLGENPDEVSNATPDSDVFRGNQETTFYVAGFPGFAYPDGLIPGTTYYWRIDEVNDANVASPWKGEVWSFSIPPKTAYNPDPADGAEFVDPDAATLSWTAGFGAKLHTVYFGDDYDTVNDSVAGIPSGLTSYNPGPLELEKVYYWRVDEFDAIETHKGDVWSFTTPGAVGNPQPAYDATDVAMNATLSWTVSDSAASHELYFGTDKDAVRNAGTGSPEYVGSKALGAESHDPGLLEPDTTYYWRVDEVDGQGNTAKGPLWLFTTGTFLLVDGFESYTDDDAAGEAIWQTWIDGFGVADNGAQAGNLLPPYAEQTIVHGGAQSMPLLYINEAGVTNSEAAKTLTAPRDWTEAGVVELSLWYRGRSDNAGEPMYAAVSNAGGAPAVVANDDPAAAQILDWTEWRVLLQTFADQGVNLTNVDKIGIGLGSKSGMASAGGTGTVFIDDIRLYQAAP
jgi:hypothetical protein